MSRTVVTDILCFIRLYDGCKNIHIEITSLCFMVFFFFYETSKQRPRDDPAKIIGQFKRNLWNVIAAAAAVYSRREKDNC